MKLFKYILFFLFIILNISISYAQRKETEAIIFTNATTFYMGIQASNGVVVAGEQTIGLVVTNMDTSASNVFYFLPSSVANRYLISKTNANNFVNVIYSDVTNVVGGIAIIDCFPVGSSWVIRW